MSDYLAAIRRVMARDELQGYWVPSTDEHLNEYVPLWAARREELSGFSGSAGDVLVAAESAWLFTDGRYHIQAARELEGSGIELMAVGRPGVPSLLEFVSDRASARPGYRLGVDPWVISETSARQWRRLLSSRGGELGWVSSNPVDEMWVERPVPPRSRLEPVPELWHGRLSSEKIAGLRRELERQRADGVILSKLDQIAWLFNLRSRDDIPFNPVFEAYAWIGRDEAHLFVHGGRERVDGLEVEGAGWEARPYGELCQLLARGGRVVLDPSGVSAGLVDELQRAGAELVEVPSGVERDKSRKSQSERRASRGANLAASVAKTQALLWLRRRLKATEPVTEVSFRSELEARYRAVPDYLGLSFPTISAAGVNAAMCHYSGCAELPFEEATLFLIDSGIHAAGGTTDDTRTVAVGSPTQEQIEIYSAVLKAHIAVARQRFPAGTSGAALDALARGALWSRGLVYDHGTGHGVGAWLNVHEGPFSIAEVSRKPSSINPLEPGNITSVEPGCYREGWGGIRLENLYLVVEAEPGWLRLESLTWIPFDTTLVDREQLGHDDCRWLDDYHGRCVELLSPELSASERDELLSWMYAREEDEGCASS